MFYKSLLKPLLFQLEEEKAHGMMTLTAQKADQSLLAKKFIQGLYDYHSPLLEQEFWGKTFQNPVGLAAGFDKNGYLVPVMQSVGMGFTEVGSVTAKPSEGNPRPRVFRLPEDRALINRMGLNNEGAEIVIDRLHQSRPALPTGINIAKTPDPKISGDGAIRDYLFSFQKACEVADYITINISCPNSADGRTFEDPALLDELLSALTSEDFFQTTPTLVKFSSDLKQNELEQQLEVCESHQINGYVACNTSSSRAELSTSAAKLQAIGEGGLSGAPLFYKSMITVGWVREMIGREKPIIAAGGIDSFEKALKMLKAGANLLQIYTGLIYEGPGLVKNINKKLTKFIKQNQLNSIREI